MFVRKIAEHLRAQNWFAVALDFLIVVVGVFVGLQVDNWNQARVDQNRETEYLLLIDIDLKRDIEALEVVRSGIQLHVEGAQLIRDSVSVPGTPTVELEKAFSSLYLTYVYTPQQPTYLGLRNGAELDIVQDLDLRSSIIDYYEIRQTRFQMEYMGDYAITQRLLHQHFSKHVRLLPPSRSDVLWPAPADLHWTALIAPFPDGAVDIGFLNDLSEVGARGGEILEVMNDLQSNNRALQAAIQQHLADSA